METKRGRPQKPEGERAESVFQIRLTTAEKTDWQASAQKAGMSLAAWMKDRLNRSSAKELKQP